MNNPHIRTSLQKFHGRDPWTEEEIRRREAEAWHRRHYLGIDLDDSDLVLDDWFRQACENLGAKLHGRRGAV